MMTSLKVMQTTVVSVSAAQKKYIAKGKNDLGEK